MGDLVLEILTQLRLMDDFKLVTIWNNQSEYMNNSENYSIPNPSLYIEMITDNFGQLSEGYQGVDLELNLHIIQEFYNGDNIDENLTIFNLRDCVVRNFSLWKATKTGFFTKISENQDYDHNNLYHYVIKFSTHWIDDTAVDKCCYETEPPTNWSPILSVTQSIV